MLVQNLPKDINPFTLQGEIDTVFSKIFNASVENYYVKSRVIGNYDSLYRQVKKLQKFKIKYESVGRNTEIRVSKFPKCCCFANKENAMKYYTNKIETLKNEMKEELSTQKQNAGYGFLIFDVE